MTFENAMKKISAFPRTNGRATVSRMALLCRYLGNPEKKLKFIHVAGTNGKGSVASMTDEILHRSGYRVGRYISPYILNFRERMTFDGRMIPRDELPAFTEKVLAAAERMERDIEAAKSGERTGVAFPREILDGSVPAKPVQFEIVTAIAFLFFLYHNCDIVVLECGLGGKFDATNVIEPPLVAVLCGIGLDHAELLGDTVAKIAAEKSGIIKEGTRYVISAPQVADALRPIEAACRAADSNLMVAGKTEIIRSAPLGLEFSYRGENYSLALCAAYQATNASVVLEIMSALRRMGMSVPDKAVREGFSKVRFPARFEVFSVAPTVIIDGAHNEHGVTAFCLSVRAMREHFRGDVTFLAAMLRDKEPERALAPFAQLVLSDDIKVKKIVTFEADNPRSMPSSELAEILVRLTEGRIEVESSSDIKKTAPKILSELGRDDSAIAFGSLYGASELRTVVSEYYGLT